MLTPPATGLIVPGDVRTWPADDAIDAIVAAIAWAEGYGAGSRGGTDSAGTSRHNPCDISDNGNPVSWNRFYPSSEHSGSQIPDYLTHTNGWRIARNKIQRILDGKSHLASKSTTWQQLAQVWVGDEKRRPGWVRAVTRRLGVRPGDRMGDYVEALTS
jgi:hypothetical protein